MTTLPVALVTGTSSGIGLWTAVGLAQAGLHVVATMRDPGRSARLRDAAAAEGVEVDVWALDVTDRAAAARCVAQLHQEYGGVEVLVNNAGQGSVATLEQLDDAALQAQLDVNYLAPAALTRLVLPGMRAAGKGRIITVTSVGGVVGQPFADAYCGAKFAVEGLMQSLAPVAARFGVQSVSSSRARWPATSSPTSAWMRRTRTRVIPTVTSGGAICPAANKRSPLRNTPVRLPP